MMMVMVGLLHGPRSRWLSIPGQDWSLPVKIRRSPRSTCHIWSEHRATPRSKVMVVSSTHGHDCYTRSNRTQNALVALFLVRGFRASPWSRSYGATVPGHGKLIVTVLQECGGLLYARERSGTRSNGRSNRRSNPNGQRDLVHSKVWGPVKSYGQGIGPCQGLGPGQIVGQILPVKGTVHSRDVVPG